MAQEGLDDVSRCPVFQPSGCRGGAKHAGAHAASPDSGERLKELVGVVGAQWFTQRRLVEVDEHEIAAVAPGYRGPLELIVGVEVDDAVSDRNRAGKSTLGQRAIRIGAA